jgi:hypothetical protein
VAQRDPVTGRFLVGHDGALVGRMTRAKKARMRLEEIENSLENGEMPLDFLLRIMRDRRGAWEHAVLGCQGCGALLPRTAPGADADDASRGRAPMGADHAHGEPHHHAAA